MANKRKKVKMNKANGFPMPRPRKVPKQTLHELIRKIAEEENKKWDKKHGNKNN